MKKPVWKGLLITAFIGVGAAGYDPVQGQPPSTPNNLMPITATNAATLHELTVLYPQSTAPIPTLVWSPDSHILYSGGKHTGNVTAWELLQGSRNIHWM